LAFRSPRAPARASVEVEREGEISRSCRYRLSPARLSAEAFAKAVRAHSRVENSRLGGRRRL
jgi:hypothetical protein